MTLRSASLALLASFSIACNLVDNQQAISYQDEAVTNPAPSARDFVANNSAHKVLLGIIDTGVDYNHPVLANHIHFDLDTSGKPSGAGFDFVGQDSWPSPYLARTALYDPEVSEEERVAAKKMHRQASAVLQNAPELSHYLNLQRHVTQELRSGSFHGTHVAGLMIYDRPDFGLRIYRVLPQNKSRDASFDYASEAIESVLEAIRLAADEGVRIVNFSLGVDYSKAIAGEDSKDSVSRWIRYRHYAEKLKSVIQGYPEILFVAAAGNEAKWRDGENLSGFPCGLKLQNVLCVGALRENGHPASFTNLINSGADVVFALGVNVISTFPKDMCVTESMNQLAEVAALPSEAIPESFYRKVSASLKQECDAQGGFGKMSGTSMAAPLVAHLAAEVLAEKPELDAAGMIRVIYSKAIPSFIGTTPVYKLNVKKPSWYSEQRAVMKSSDSAYWQAIWAH